MPFQPAPTNLCPICHDPAHFAFKRDHQNDSGTFSLYECSSCQVQFWVPLNAGTAEWYQKTYASEYAVRGAIAATVQRAYHHAALKRIAKSSPGTSVLDVACGTGEFLAVLQKQGLDVWGVDHNVDAILQAQASYQLNNVRVGSTRVLFPEYEGYFDFVTCFEFIEHVEDPLDLFNDLKRLLKPGGILMVSTPSRERVLPNLNSWDFPPHHLTRWSESSLVSLANRVGFKHRSSNYTDAFRFIFSGMGDQVRLHLAAKIAKRVKGTKFQFLVKIGRYLERAKDLLLVGAPAIFVYMVSTLRGRKNGDMLVEFLRKD